MRRLLEKLHLLKPKKHGPKEKTAAKKPEERGPLWVKIGVGVVLALAALFWFTSAKVVSDPFEVSFGPENPAFADALGPLLGAEFLGGNTVTTLVNGDEFFPVMLRDIASAQHTITLETYIWESGVISDKFIAALTERSRAGVKVAIMVDGMGSLKFKHEDREQLERAGIKVVTYGRKHWYEIKPNINHRTHRKILVIDGRIGYTGGMCVADKWMGHAQSKEVWRETQVRVEGPVVREMQAVFATNWLQTTSKLLLGENYFPVIPRKGEARAQCFKSGPGEGTEAARTSYLLAIAAARKTIDISHAYFVPDDLAIDMLIAARKRGVKIRVIVPAINDSRFGRAASRSRWGKLLAEGVEFYQYEPAMFHCKTMVADDLFVTIGSVNFDNRSFSINDEDALNVIDPKVAADHERVFEDDLKHSKPLTREMFEHRPFYIKLADHFCGLFRSQF